MFSVCILRDCVHVCVLLCVWLFCVCLMFVRLRGVCVVVSVLFEYVFCGL